MQQTIQEVLNFIAGITGNENPDVDAKKIKLSGLTEPVEKTGGFFLLRFRGVDVAGTMNISYKGRGVKQIYTENNFDTGDILVVCDSIDSIDYAETTGLVIAEGWEYTEPVTE